MDGEVRAAMVLVHDIHSRVARWEHLIRSLEARGIALHAPAVRYDARSIERLACDIGKVVSRLRELAPTRPLLLLGEGAGAVVAASCALGKPTALDGLICAGLALEPALSATRLRILRMLASIGPRSRARSTAHSVLDLIRAGEQMRASIPRLCPPLLVLHGGMDPVARLSGSEYLHQRASSRDKTLLIFEGYHHDLLSGEGHEAVIEKLVQWIDARLQAVPDRAHTQVGIEYINDPS
jgi:alpha-beta hydrolase superfamily lysophospholipase